MHCQLNECIALLKDAAFSSSAVQQWRDAVLDGGFHQCRWDRPVDR